MDIYTVSHLSLKMAVPEIWNSKNVYHSRYKLYEPFWWIYVVPLRIIVNNFDRSMLCHCVLLLTILMNQCCATAYYCWQFWWISVVLLRIIVNKFDVLMLRHCVLLLTNLINVVPLGFVNTFDASMFCHCVLFTLLMD